MRALTHTATFGRLLRPARALLDLLLPPQCLACDRPVSAPGQLCGGCFGRMTFIARPLCARCGAPASAGAAALCRHCERHPPLYDRARGALRYDEQSRPLLLGFKYADRTELAPALARFMAQAGAALLREADLLVPVPLHRARLLARRYNQAALLALALGRQAGRPVLVDALRRHRHTTPLGQLSAAARRDMLAGSIAVMPRQAHRLAGRRVLLIDDVLTSGATADACAQALLAAGALAVDVLAAARVAPPA